MLTNVQTSYCYVFEPKAIDEKSTPKYSITVLIDKNDSANIEKVTKAVNDAYADGIVKKWGNAKPLMFKHPLRDGNLKDLEKYPEFRDKFFISCSSNDKPLIVAGDRSVITDKSLFYSGCIANVLIHFYPYSKAGNNGVAVGLKGAQFVSKGANFVGGALDSDFDMLDSDFDRPDSDFKGFPFKV